ncbi:hypothetical protein G6F35_014116 [Rhizopus arrhizus]|nr:hypothetical protein G6F35_014116 [Rhizopus arrhizus]
MSRACPTPSCGLRLRTDAAPPECLPHAWPGTSPRCGRHPRCDRPRPGPGTPAACPCGRAVRPNRPAVRRPGWPVPASTGCGPAAGALKRPDRSFQGSPGALTAGRLHPPADTTGHRSAWRRYRPDCRRRKSPMRRCAPDRPPGLRPARAAAAWRAGHPGRAKPAPTHRQAAGSTPRRP